MPRITNFVLATVNGTINETAKTIAVKVPFGTNVTNQTATVTHDGISIMPAGAQNFTNPVKFYVNDGTTVVEYTVTVTVETQKKLKFWHIIVIIGVSLYIAFKLLSGLVSLASSQAGAPSDKRVEVKKAGHIDFTADHTDQYMLDKDSVLIMAVTLYGAQMDFTFSEDIKIKPLHGDAFIAKAWTRPPMVGPEFSRVALKGLRNGTIIYLTKIEGSPKQLPHANEPAK